MPAAMILHSVRTLGRRAALVGGLSSGTVGLATQWHMSKPAQCADKPSMSMPAFEMPKDMSEWQTLGGGVGVGSILGFTSGFALKKISAGAAVIFGGLFAIQQGLAYAGYVNVNWKKVEADLTTLLDVNK